ncbi:class I SAM-dependent methyltransferase [Sphingobacterium sp. N143]|uniref:class I SAM-dependent methyltransferase n=1 Tax=Sphingobacterium sp. N143 TaxID=2746727 RepID=UPI0025757EDC|nr:class I SAM-dependent methyltransferase [Sphingobacterium sp. N143]
MEFWERNFIEKGAMWGNTPASSTVIAKDFFLEKNVKEILIPGFGYGRNAKLFLDNGMQVTGIELSKTAIELAKKHVGHQVTIYQGSVTAMPFDQKKYAGIYCYALIHLLDTADRKKFIHDCFDQLSDDGYMIFTALSKKASSYGQGQNVGKDRFELFNGVKMFFYDEESIHAEFDAYGLLAINEVKENYPFYLITCKK